MNIIQKSLIVSMSILVLCTMAMPAMAQITWSSDIRLTTTDQESINPSIAVDSNDNIHIAWGDQRDIYFEIYYTKLDNNGATLVDDTKLTTTTYYSWKPSIAVDSNDNIHIVWQDKRDGAYEIYYTKLDNNGNTLVDDTRLTTTTYDSQYPSIAVDSNNNIHIVWQDKRDDPITKWEIYYTKLNNNGNTLVDDTRLTTTTESSQYSSIAVDSNDNIHIAWDDQRDGNYEIYYTKLDNNGNTLVDDTRLTNDSQYSYNPKIALDSNNNIHITWQDKRDEPTTKYEIYYKNGTLAAAAKPNLNVTAITTPANVFANESNGINATIKNNGTGDAGAFNVSLSADGTVVDSTSVAGLSAGASTEVSLEWTPSASGTYELCVVADCDGVIDESDETNNVTCEDVDVEDMPAAKPDLIVTEVNAYRLEEKYGYVWFNLTNYVDVTVKNNGTTDADAFNVSLYADGEPIGVLPVINLSNGSSETLVFKWRPEGEDPLRWTDTAEGAILSQTGTSKTYTLEAVVDEANEVSESNESNNNMTASETVKWNGYMADEPLENYAHGTVRGGLIYTTGDGWYHSGEGGTPGTVYGTYSELPYDLEIPGDTKLARLYFYHTWSKPGWKAPKVGITLKTPSNDIYELNMEKSYNDMSTLGGYGELAWGTYTYNITGYVTESGTYVVNITNLNDGTDADFAHHCSFAAPAVLFVYENKTMPEREYWVNEGADVLWGKKDMTGLLLEDCINNATFEGSIDLSKVKNATLAVVSPWGEQWDRNVLYFNGIELGTGVYDNGVYPIGDISLDGIRMYSTCPSNWRQEVGVNLSDVTGYLNASVNIAGQGDNRDCMMPSNAFLVVEYEEEEISEFDTRPGTYPSIMGTHNGTIRPSHDVYVSKIYTYACTGTGGHTEYVRIWNESVEPIAEGHWTGYAGSNYHNITFDTTFTLFADHTYNYTIRTGSYPQIHHTPALHTDDGWINCTEFVDANGRRYDNWIPAIRLESGT
ncbi:hypothetical protein ES705_03246 [subsurface metagenome]